MACKIPVGLRQISTTGIAYTCACHLYHVDVEITSCCSICLTVISLHIWVHYYYYLTTSAGYLTTWKRVLQQLQKLVFIAFLLDIPGLAARCGILTPRRKSISPKIIYQKNISLNVLFPELRLVRNHTCKNEHLPEITSARMNTCLKLHLPE